ncbi:hypothetical protein MBLNU457_6011t1 [Dothideomycetes sp. NU457]
MASSVATETVASARSATARSEEKHDEQEEADEDDSTTTANEPAVPRDLSTGGLQESFDTPTKQSRELLQSLKLQSAQAERVKDFAMKDAIQRKISELEENGWAPDDEEFPGLDDDDYNDVDLIHDQDESFKSARLEKERAKFLAGEMDAREQSQLARRLSLNTNATSDMEDMEEMDLTVLDELDFAPGDANSLGFFLDQEHRAKYGDSAENIFSPDSDGSFFEQAETQRRVRFEDELDGSDAGSIDSDQVAETFPDLFMEAHQLGPLFQHMANNELFNDDDGSETGSCWDFDGDEMAIDAESEDHQEDDESDEEVGASSGYSSDDGETTDEEAPPDPSSVRRIIERRPSNSQTRGESAATSQTPTSINRVAKRKSSTASSGPRMPTAGTFMLDPRRPVLLVDGAGRHQRNTFYPAKIQSQADKQFWLRLHQMYRTRTSGPVTSVQLTPSDESDFDPMSAQGTPNSFFDMFGTLRGDQVIGPPEAFMPFTNIEAAGMVTEDNIPDSEGGEEEDEDDILALVNFDSSSEDDEAGDEDDNNESAWQTTAKFPYLSSKGSKKSGDDLLAHLDRNRGLVGSFRRNQHYAKQIGSMASHPIARASTSEMNAMQAGRRSAANTPITPLRKKRIGKDVGFRTSPVASPVPKTSNKRRGPVRGGFGSRR